MGMPVQQYVQAHVDHAHQAVKMSLIIAGVVTVAVVLGVVVMLFVMIGV